MLELSIAIGIVVLILAIAIPNYRYHAQKRSQEGARDQVASLFGYARQIAVERGGATITVSGPPLVFTLRQADGTLIRSVAVADGVTVQTPGGATTFTFGANGSVSSGGDFVFRIPSALDVTMTLDAMTGATVSR
jgi:Tfp pilus assembly protein FimT